MEAQQVLTQDTQRPKPKTPVKIPVNHFQEAIYEYTHWVADAPEGHTMNDITDPGYWGNVSERFRPWDHIFVRAADGTWFAELLVLNCDRSWAKVFVKNHQRISEEIEQPTALDPYEVSWRGPHRKWSVIRKTDRAVIKDEIQTRDLANQIMLEHMKAMT